MSVPPTIHVRWVEPATVVDAIGPKLVSTDGPFADTQVHLGGFWIIKASDPGRGVPLGTRGLEGLCRPGRGAPNRGRARGVDQTS